MADIETRWDVDVYGPGTETLWDVDVYGAGTRTQWDLLPTEISRGVRLVSRAARTAMVSLAARVKLISRYRP